MALSFSPRIAPDDHPDHVAGDAVVCRDHAVRTARVIADRDGLLGGQPIPGMRSFVFELLLSGRPLAVLRRVIAVIVDALNGPFVLFANRARPHVGKEAFEAAPSLADLDAPTTVVVKRLGGRPRGQ